MIAIGIILLLTLFVIIRVSRVDFISKFVLYCFGGYWLFAFILSCINPFNYYTIEFRSYAFILLGVFSFVVGMMIFPGNNLRVNHEQITRFFMIDMTVEKLLSNKVVLFLFLVIEIYCIPIVIRAVTLAEISGGGGVAANMDPLESVFLNNSFNSLLFQYVMYPLLHLDYALLTFSIINKKKNWLSLVVYVFYLFEFMMIGGARSVILVAFMYIVIIYICVTPKSVIKKISFRRIIATSLLLAVIVYSISIMTSYRTSGDLFSKNNNTERNAFQEATERIAGYSILPFGLFNEALQNGICEKYQYTFGRATFAGVDVLVNGLAKRLGIPYETTMDIVFDVQNNYVKIGTDHYYNYAYTGLFYHYIDFGIFGIFLFPFVFGLLFRMIVINFYRDPNIGWLLLIGLAFFLALHSLFTCYFIKPWVIPYIIILLFVAQKKKPRFMNEM